MSAITAIRNMIEGVIRKLIPYKQIEQAEHFESPVSAAMTEAIALWAQMYLNRAPWRNEQNGVKSLNLAAFVCSELARQVTIEMKWSITGTGQDSSGNAAMNDRAAYLAEQFRSCMGGALREKLEQGMAAGGMVIKPYPDAKRRRLYFDFVPDWNVFPTAFDGDRNITDVIFRDTYQDGKTYYTRLERHRVYGEDVIITQRCFRSQMPDTLGTECALSAVPAWAELLPELTVTDTGGRLLFGWYRAAAANPVDPDTVMGASVFAKAVDCIRDADEQYSRLMWEYEAKETAIDVDPSALVPKAERDTSGNVYEMPKLKKRLFRAVDLGNEKTYNVYDPPIRDISLLNGLNAILCRIEDLCGLARGTISDPTAQAMTATQILILKQRSYETISANQQALEQCLRDVVHAADIYATALELAPAGEYEASFEWDDSVVTDTGQELDQRLRLVSAGAMSKAELRMWYLGETQQQAEQAIAQIKAGDLESMAAAQGIPGLDTGDAV